MRNFHDPLKWQLFSLRSSRIFFLSNNFQIFKHRVNYHTSVIPLMLPQSRDIFETLIFYYYLRCYGLESDPRLCLPPNQLAAPHLLTVVERLLRGEPVVLKEAEMARLIERDEVMG